MALPASRINEASFLSLRCFAAVVETRNFSAAARQLQVAPSSVTKHIQLLEAVLGVALFHRTTRRIAVTEAGERFYEQCLTILAQIDSATAAMAAEQDLAGHLRVTAPPSFAAAVLGPHIHEFLRSHPGISVDIIVTSDTPDLIGDRIDVAIAVQDGPETKLPHRLLAACPRVLCASPDYVARHGMPREPDALDGHHCISGRFSDLAETWHLERDGSSTGIRVASALLSDSGELLRQACVNGAGIGNFYYFHVREDLEAGRLVRVLPAYEPRARNVYAITPHRQILRPQTRAFVAFAARLAQGALHAAAKG